MEKIGIVPVQRKHIPALARLERLCFAEPWSENALQSALDNPLSLFFAAEQDGQTLGYAGMQCVAGECYVNNIAVFPQHRGRGVGTSLVQMLITAAQQKNSTLITMEVRPSNTQAVSLYQKLGFEQVGCRKQFYRRPTEDALIFTKYLAKGDTVCKF